MEERRNKRAMRNSKRDAEKRKSQLEDKKLRIRKAIEEGIVLRKDICKIAEIKMNDLRNIFTNDRELYAEFCVGRKLITDLASENIYNIVKDPTHQKNYDASKFIIQNFKTDIDDSLESKDGEMVDIQLGGGSSGGGITLKFGKDE